MHSETSHPSPQFIYGTAWKESETKACVLRAIKVGFRAIDTANQKKHYREDDVGQALEKLRFDGIRREDLFLQSKFTYPSSQDHRIPYNLKDEVENQIRSSFDNTLENLSTSYLDSYLLHGPSSPEDLTPMDWRAWSVFEELHSKKLTRAIGVSNVALIHLQKLLEKCQIKPAFVQNRCFAVHGWDLQVRNFCKDHGIAYQGFSLLTANSGVVSHPQLLRIAKKYQLTEPQTIFQFAKNVGMIPLTGSTHAEHLKQDLATNQTMDSEDLECLTFLVTAPGFGRGRFSI